MDATRLRPLPAATTCLPLLLMLTMGSAAHAAPLVRRLRTSTRPVTARSLRSVSRLARIPRAEPEEFQNVQQQNERKQQLDQKLQLASLDSKAKLPKNLAKLALALSPLLNTQIAAAAAAADASGPAKALEVVKKAGDMLSWPIGKANEYILAPISSTLSNPVVVDLSIYATKTAIAWGVPTITIGLGLAALLGSKKNGDAELDSMEDMSPDLGGFSLNPFKAGKKKNEPKQYLKIERLNDKLNSFEFSVTKATESSKKAAAERRRRIFSEKFGEKIVGTLTDTKLEAVAKADQKYRKAQQAMLEQMPKISMELRALAAKQASKKAAKSKDGESMMSNMPMMGGDSAMKKQVKALQTKQNKILSDFNQAELNYISAVTKELDEDSRKEFVELLKQNDAGWQDGVSGLSLGSENLSEPKPHVFVMNFPGDITASQVKDLRQEVTAVIRNSNQTRGDEAILVLNTGGGTVTGYGLAASQLIRLKNAGMKLTICVEQVAASGGYMMACCADRLVASPFAVLGSIGVVTQQPNVYERLNREGVEFLTVTAGKFKRTLTPFKKATEEDIKKTEEDLEAIWKLFKDFVQSQRPKLDISEVATGETWFGQDALEKKLVDELKTTDDILLEKLDEGAEIYSVKYSEPAASPLTSLLPATSASRLESIRNAAARLLLGDDAFSAVLRQTQLESMTGSNNPADKYQMYDETALRTMLRAEEDQNRAIF